jgi:hypothetical protein
MLSATKHLGSANEMLRCAQHDKSESPFLISSISQLAQVAPSLLALPIDAHCAIE